jgi:hypothetical protein
MNGPYERQSYHHLVADLTTVLITLSHTLLTRVAEITWLPKTGQCNVSQIIACAHFHTSFNINEQIEIPA